MSLLTLRARRTNFLDRTGAAAAFCNEWNRARKYQTVWNSFLLSSLLLLAPCPAASPLSFERGEVFCRVFRSMRVKPNSHRENALKWHWKKKRQRKGRAGIFSLQWEIQKELKSGREMVPGASGAYLTVFQDFGGHHVDSVKAAVLPMYRNDDSVWDICLMSHVQVSAASQQPHVLHTCCLCSLRSWLRKQATKRHKT